MNDQMNEYRELYEAILTGDHETAVRVTKEALSNDVDPERLVSAQMIPAMDEVGRRFQCSEYFIPELLIAARAMKGALGLMRPLLAQRGAEPVGRVVIGTVKGDLHDVGKGLVASMMEGGGFEVIDLGVDVPPETFLEEAQKHNADIIALSALLTTTMTSMKAVIEGLEKAGVRDRIRVVIGGAPVSQQYADSIGADGYSDNASGAVALIRKLVAA